MKFPNHTWLYFGLARHIQVCFIPSLLYVLFHPPPPFPHRCSVMITGSVALTTGDLHHILRFTSENHIEMFGLYDGHEHLKGVFPSIWDMFRQLGITMLYGGTEGFVQLPNPPNQAQPTQIPPASMPATLQQPINSAQPINSPSFDMHSTGHPITPSGYTNYPTTSSSTQHPGYTTSGYNPSPGYTPTPISSSGSSLGSTPSSTPSSTPYNTYPTPSYNAPSPTPGYTPHYASFGSAPIPGTVSNSLSPSRLIHFMNDSSGSIPTHPNPIQQSPPCFPQMPHHNPNSFIPHTPASPSTNTTITTAYDDLSPLSRLLQSTEFAGHTPDLTFQFS